MSTLEFVVVMALCAVIIEWCGLYWIAVVMV